MRKYISTYLLSAAAAVLLMQACVAGLDDDASHDVTTALRPGERSVNLQLTGLGGGSVVENRVGNDATTRAGNESLTLAGECDIREMVIMCFKSEDTDGNPVTDLNDYRLERTYNYKEGGNTNDFLLTSDANGYHAGIGVPKDDDLSRAFLVYANPVGSVSATADGGGGITYQSVLTGKSMTVGDALTNVWFETPLPMGGKATHRVISPDGNITDNPVFTQAHLEAGVTVKMIRRVSRIDISNPDITGFKVVGINVMAAKQAFFFAAPTSTEVSPYITDASEMAPLTNAGNIPGACYLLPPAEGTQAMIGVRGALDGFGQEITLIAASTTLKPNTRYILRVRNDGSNVRLSIEVADWDEGETLPTDDISGKLNSGCEVTAANDDEASAGEATTIKLITVDDAAGTILAYYVNGVGLSSDRPDIVKVAGATGDDKPIGVIIPEDCDWLDLKVPKEVAVGTRVAETYEVTVRAKKAESLNRLVIDDIYRPCTTPITFVYRQDGKTCYKTYQLTAIRYFRSEYPAAYTMMADGYWQTHIRIDVTRHAVYLPPFAGATCLPVVTSEGKHTPVASDFSYVSEDCGWFAPGKISMGGKIISVGNKYKEYTTLEENRSGAARETGLVVNTYDGTTETADRWTVVQETEYDKSLLARDASVTLPLKSAEELRMEGNVITRGPEIINGGVIRISESQTISLGWGYEDYLNSVTLGDRQKVTYYKEHLAYIKSRCEWVFCAGSVYTPDSSPVVVTTDAPWLSYSYMSDETGRWCVKLYTDVYFPETYSEIGDLPIRSGTVTVELRDGRTKTYVVRQEPEIKQRD